MTTPRFDLDRVLAAHQSDTLDLHAQLINPAMAAVLRTIGFDARYTRGEGAYLFDERGQRYLDCLGGYAVFNVGRNHPVVRDALKQAMDADLPNLPGVGTFRTSGILADELVRLSPAGLERVFFASAGGEAVDAAMKFARGATGRSGIVHCTRSYHGLTMGALSVTGNHEFRDGFGSMLPGATEIPFNDLDALERVLSTREHAAFIVEPIQGKGVNVPGSEYLRRASALCRRTGTLMILDEIQTGMGRTGALWACEHFGVTMKGGESGTDGWSPDLMVIAKGLSGGYVPVSAVLMRREVSDAVFSSMNACSRIQNTFSQNDLAMVAGLATLHVMRHERIPERARESGAYLTQRLREELGGFEMVKEVRGLGLMIAVEFQRPRSLTLRTAWDMLHKADPSLFCQSVLLPMMSKHRVLAQVAGHRLDVIKLIPTLVLTREDCDWIVEAMRDTVSACHRFPGPAWEVGKRLSAAAVKRLTSVRPRRDVEEPVG